MDIYREREEVLVVPQYEEPRITVVNEKPPTDPNLQLQYEGVVAPKIRVYIDEKTGLKYIYNFAAYALGFIDYETFLYNDKGLYSITEEQIERLEEMGYKIEYILLDMQNLDIFKTTNDVLNSSNYLNHNKQDSFNFDNNLGQSISDELNIHQDIGKIR